MDFNEPKRTGMSVEAEKYFGKTKIDGPVCLLVGERSPLNSNLKLIVFVFCGFLRAARCRTFTV